MKNRFDSLDKKFSQDTVLADWLVPMNFALEKVRYSESTFGTLKMPMFILLGCLWQIKSHKSLRKFVQFLYSEDDEMSLLPPLARSTWSDALASKKRKDILRTAFTHLVSHARNELVDRLQTIDNLGQRAVFCADASYQTESTHYQAVYPNEKDAKGKKGTDNPKGHMLMTLYDLRHGIPLDAKTETESKGEMRVIKESLDAWITVKNSLWVVDRAFLDVRYWEEKNKKFNITVVTRKKSNMTCIEETERTFDKNKVNEGVLSDKEVKLTASNRVAKNAPLWRLIEFKNERGEIHTYLTNDFDLEPGEIAFLYHRRWDEEKLFDNLKNDLVNNKAWSKNKNAIEQQMLFALVTYILTKLFIEKQCNEQGISGDKTQSGKHKKKQRDYKEKGGIYLRAYWAHLSKIPAQVWRFLDFNFCKKPSKRLYERRFRPIIEAYL